MIEIANESELLRYMVRNNLFSNGDQLSVRYFSGGVSGTVALVKGGEKKMIVKQALSVLKVSTLWECDRSRIRIEHEALELYNQLIPGRVPEPIFYDEENYIMVREALPETCSAWKEQLLSGLLDFSIAHKAIDALSVIHNGTAGDDAVSKRFEDTQFFYNLRITPYIGHVVESYPSLAAPSKRIIEMLMEDKIALVHGDYSPKNILVNGSDIAIIDLEVAHYGHPAFDLAFFANHLLLKAIKNKQWSNAYLNMLSFMLDIYTSQLTCINPVDMEHNTVRTLALLLLARVDGKSPAEYITQPSDKDIVRKTAMTMITDDIANYKDAIALLKRNLK